MTDKEKRLVAAKRTRLWRLANPERAKANDKAGYARNRDRMIARATITTRLWRKQNPELARERCRASYHGISVIKLRKLYVQQKNRCAICGLKEDPKQRFHYDHDHRTGKFRGLICRDHNVGLTINTTPAILRKMAAYLEQHGEA